MIRFPHPSFVHPDNPVRQLTRQQIGDIFAGEITSWKEAGARDRLPR